MIKYSENIEKLKNIYENLLNLISKLDENKKFDQYFKNLNIENLGKILLETNLENFKITNILDDQTKYEAKKLYYDALNIIFINLSENKKNEILLLIRFFI